MQWKRCFPSVDQPRGVLEAEKSKAQEHSQHKQMLENLQKFRTKAKFS